MEYKRYYFDVEIIIDHTLYKLCTHHIRRGLTFAELGEVIRDNFVPKDDSTRITFNIRGVNY